MFTTRKHNLTIEQATQIVVATCTVIMTIVQLLQLILAVSS